VDLRKSIKHLIVVVFPAPLGPKNPKTSPSSIENETSLIALVLPKYFFRFLGLST